MWRPYWLSLTCSLSSHTRPFERREHCGFHVALGHRIIWRGWSVVLCLGFCACRLTPQTLPGKSQECKPEITHFFIKPGECYSFSGVSAFLSWCFHLLEAKLFNFKLLELILISLPGSSSLRSFVTFPCHSCNGIGFKFSYWAAPWSYCCITRNNLFYLIISEGPELLNEKVQMVWYISKRLE